jgi:hypothetical protein
MGTPLYGAPEIFFDNKNKINKTDKMDMFSVNYLKYSYSLVSWFTK